MKKQNYMTKIGAVLVALLALVSAPKDESLLRNVRRELEDHFEQYKRDIKIARYQYENGQRVNS